MNQNPNQRIFDVVQEIAAKRYRIPSIQRGYELQPERVLKLLDSIASSVQNQVLKLSDMAHRFNFRLPRRRDDVAQSVG